MSPPMGRSTLPRGEASPPKGRNTLPRGERTPLMGRSNLPRGEVSLIGRTFVLRERRVHQGT